MEIAKYEIDMLDVKNADAILIHFFDTSENEYVVLVDGGNYGAGETVAKFIKSNYSKKQIDLAICTHCDKDHFGGILALLEQMRDNVKEYIPIKKIWIHDPARHVERGMIKWITDKEEREVKARSVYDIGDKNLWDVLDELIENDRIEWAEPFSNPQDMNQEIDWNGVISVVGPTVDYYTKFVPNFRNDLKKRKNGYKFDEPEEIDIEEADESLNKRIDEAGDDDSPHNRPSVIFLFQPSKNDKCLFTGDASRDSFNNLRDKPLYDSLANVRWLKVPHHGSIYNLDSTLISHFCPKKAYISTKEYNNYLSISIKNALKKVKAEVYATCVGGSKQDRYNLPLHDGYVLATKL